MLADVPIVFVLIGIAAYTVLSGADFGAGMWMLIPGGGHADAATTRDHTRHSIGPVWEANHVWLIFVLTVAWTCYPGAFGSIVSTLAIPLLIAAIGIIFRGTTYALRSQFDRREGRGVALVEDLFALSSVLTPFALATVVGAIATGRVPVGNARGNIITSWLNPVSIMAGVLAVAGLLVVRFNAAALWHGLTSGAGLALVIVSGVAGLLTLVLVWRSSFGLARASAALAVAAVIAGWAAAQEPRFLPGLTVREAAAGSATLIATIIGVAVGAAVLVPSLGLLYTLVLRGRLDTAGAAMPAVPAVPVVPSVAAGPTGAAGAAGPTGAGRGRIALGRPAWAFAVVSLLAGVGLMIFAGPAWALGIGALLLVACAVTVFALTAIPDEGT